MGGKGAAMTSISPSSAAAAVCCMCGDHGLPQELFRCKVCHDRSQHKYCSDLYPKEEQYRVCNWCLREGGRPPGSGGNSNSNISSPSTSDAGSGSGFGGGGGVKLHRGSFSSHLNKPIKKQRVVPKRSVSDVTERMGSEAAGRRTRQGFRGKARRYKLLEDVST